MDLMMSQEQTPFPFESIKTAYPKGLPVGVDKIWFADTSIQSAIEFMDFTAHIEK